MELFYLEQGWEPSLRFSPHPWPLSIISWVPRTALTQRPHAIVGVPVQNNLRLILVYPVFFSPIGWRKEVCVYGAYPLCLLLLLFICLFIYLCLFCCTTWKASNLAENQHAILSWWVLNHNIHGWNETKVTHSWRKGRAGCTVSLAHLDLSFGPPVPYQNRLLVQLKHLEVCSPPNGTGMKNCLQVKHRQYLRSAARRGAWPLLRTANVLDRCFLRLQWIWSFSQVI